MKHLPVVTDEITVLDFAVQLQSPVVVVAANRLGVISHTRLTIRDRLRQSGLNVAAVILNAVQPSIKDDASADSNARQIAYWLPDVALLSVGFQSEIIYIRHNEAALTTTFLHRIIDRF